MMFDLLVRDARLADRPETVDIAVSGDRIVAVEPRIDAQAGRIIEAEGQLVAPPFVDPHFHLDATLSLGQPRLNQSGTLLEGIGLWGELKPLLTREAVIGRAQRYCDLAIANGLLAIRTHVDICDERLLAVEALLELRERMRPFMDIQLVAFPQDGYYRSPVSIRTLQRALDMGVDVVGGIPHFERTQADGTASVRALCEIAADRGLMVDLHCDETDDPLSRHVETLAAETLRLGLGGRVTGSHLTSMHSMDNYYVSKLLPMMAEAGLSAIANPLINLTLQGRHDTYPRRRGITRIQEMRAHGIVVALGQDCCMDPWYGLGGADMLDVAHMAIHAVPMTSREAMAWCFDAVTTAAARIMGLPDYGVAPGNYADFVLLQARDPIEAIRLRATRLAVVRRGEVIAKTPAQTSWLQVPGRPKVLNRADYAPVAGGEQGQNP